LCAQYDIIPDKDLASKHYSDSIAKANLVTGQPIFTFYKKGYLFELANGVSLNKDVKKQKDSERNSELIEKARLDIEKMIKK
jgi:hypothetical protein